MCCYAAAISCRWMQIFWRFFCRDFLCLYLLLQRFLRHCISVLYKLYNYGSCWSCTRPAYSLTCTLQLQDRPVCRRHVPSNCKSLARPPGTHKHARQAKSRVRTCNKNHGYIPTRDFLLTLVRTDIQRNKCYAIMHTSVFFITLVRIDLQWNKSCYNGKKDIYIHTCTPVFFVTLASYWHTPDFLHSVASLNRSIYNVCEIMNILVAWILAKIHIEPTLGCTFHCIWARMDVYPPNVKLW